MQIQKASRPQRWAFFVLSSTMGLMVAASPAIAQNPDQTWMNSALSPENRAELVLKQMTLDEKIALLHGNGMAHASAVADALDPSLEWRRRLCRRGEAIRHSSVIHF